MTKQYILSRPLIKRAALAKMAGISRSTITRWLKEENYRLGQEAQGRIAIILEDYGYQNQNQNQI